VASLAHLGSGFDLSVADLEQRGAGDLLGEEQAGHLRLIGTELYRHILRRALAQERGETVEEEWTPAIAMDVEAVVPADFIPEAETRLEIYHRLGRTWSLDALDDISAEFADRSGALPPAFTALLDWARRRLLCREERIAAGRGPESCRLHAAERVHGFTGATI
jgi:transcription-repair coupling factor (superfamily II helicase)